MYNLQIYEKKIGDVEKNVVDARELHKALEVKSTFREWIVRRLDQTQFNEGQDFIISSEIRRNSRRGRSAKKYTLHLL